MKTHHSTTTRRHFLKTAPLDQRPGLLRNLLDRESLGGGSPALRGLSG